MVSEALNFLQNKEDERVSRIAALATSLKIDFKEAEKVIGDMSSEYLQPGELQVEYESKLDTEFQREKINNIADIQTVSKVIVNRALGELNLYNVLETNEIKKFRDLVQEELKETLKKTKVIDILELKQQNEVLRKAYIAVKVDRGRLKNALEGTLSGMVAYSVAKDSEGREKIENYRKKAGEALLYSDKLEAKDIETI